MLPGAQVRKSNLCPAASSEGLPGPSKLLILNGDDLNPKVTSWAPQGINKTHTIVHIYPVQLLEKSLGAYPKGSKGFLGESVWNSNAAVSDVLKDQRPRKDIFLGIK